MFHLHRDGGHISTAPYLSRSIKPLTLRPLNTEIIKYKAPIPDNLSLPVSCVALWVNKVYGYKRYFIFGIIFETEQRIRGWLRKPQRSEIPRQLHFDFQKNGIEVSKVIPRRKENGCYLFFIDPTMAKKAQQLLTQGSSPKHEAFFVLGEPLIEDISMIKPNKKLKVDAKVLLTEDFLFQLCRPYGKIRIISNKSIHDVYLVFAHTRCAISARNCLHKIVEDNQTIQFKYESPKRFKYWAWLSKQYYPLILVLIVVLLFFMIEPLRLFSVLWRLWKEHLCSVLWRLWEEHAQLRNIPGDPSRDDDIEDLLQKLTKSPLMILSGPSESGRTNLVKRLKSYKPYTIFVDFDNRKLITGAPIDDGLLESLASSIGYQPSFKAVNETWATIQIFMGAKKEIASTSKLGQMERLLKTLGNALKKLPRKRKPTILFDKFNEFMERVEDCTPEEQKNVSNFIKALILWSEETSRKDKTANIVFVGNNMTKLKMLKYAPKQCRSIEVHQLKDFTKEKTRELLMKNLLKGDPAKNPEANIKDEDFEEMWSIIGGRPAHFQQVIGAAKEGKNIAKKAKSLLDHDKKNVCTDAIGDTPGNETPTKKWTKVQFWKIIRLLVNADEEEGVEQDVLLAACRGDPQPLNSLATANWIMRVHTDLDKDFFCSPSPLRKATYKALLQDESLLKRIGPLEDEEDINVLEEIVTKRESEVKLSKRITELN